MGRGEMGEIRIGSHNFFAPHSSLFPPHMGQSERSTTKIFAPCKGIDRLYYGTQPVGFA